MNAPFHPSMYRIATNSAYGFSMHLATSKFKTQKMSTLKRAIARGSGRLKSAEEIAVRVTEDGGGLDYLFSTQWENSVLRPKCVQMGTEVLQGSKMVMTSLYLLLRLLFDERRFRLAYIDVRYSPLREANAT